MANGIGHENEPVRGGRTDAGKQGKVKVNGASAKSAKRKPGESGVWRRTVAQGWWIRI